MPDRWLSNTIRLSLTNDRFELLIRTGSRSSTRRRTRTTLLGTPVKLALLRPFSSATSMTRSCLR
jgi:hypothetical protein